VAGVVVNLLVAFVLFTAILASTGFRTDQPTSIPTSGRDIRVNFPFGQQTDSILISFVDPGSAADKGGLKALDELVTVEGRTFSEINEFRNYHQKIKVGS
jgi:S1-C subfamily serine protease